VIKSSIVLLKKLEILLKEGGYKLRFERGNFKPGHCVLLENKVVVVNKFYTNDVKVSALIEIVRELQWRENDLSLESRKLLDQINQMELKL
jgi:hypothetical protein